MTYDYQQAISDIRKHIERFRKIEGKPWTTEANFIELVKQVGDLSKLVMTNEGYYFADRSGNSRYVATKEKIADEIADLFFMLVRIADGLDIDILEASQTARKKENKFLKSKDV
jgi:NTP pyrophosphatase (non-canonical NTP hydrolase)